MVFTSSLANTIVVEAPVVIATPRILWPTMVRSESSYIAGDLEYFPDNESYLARRQLGIGGAVSSVFKDAVRFARRRIWLFDEQILRNEGSFDQLWDLFSNTDAWDIRIITAPKEGASERAALFKDLEEELQKRNTVPPLRIQIFLDINKKGSSLPDVHDRFAVIDDVLWHCGATIGGLHNSINAMTFGWSAIDTKAIDFFERSFRLLEKRP